MFHSNVVKSSKDSDMKKFNKFFITGCLMLLSLSCSEDYLDVNPKASVRQEDLATDQGVDGIIIGAYKGLTWSITGEYGGYSSGGFSDNMSDDRSTGTYNYSLNSGNSRWVFIYNIIQRTNDALRTLELAVEKKTVTEERAKQLAGEARFLRGAFYIYLIGTFGDKVPWIDENVSFQNNNYYVPNDVSVWPHVEEDFVFAAANLSPTNGQVGRANSWAAKAFLAKTYVWQLKYAEAKPVLEDIIANGVTVNGLKYDLNPNYWSNFNTVDKHGPEVVFALQNEVKTGAYGGNAQDMYNGPYGSPATPCCGWLTPSEDLVDMHKTDPGTGLPLFDTYLDNPMPTDQGLSSAEPFTPYTGTLDSRLDHSVGRRGIPFLDWGVHPGMAWIRFQNREGPYSAKKNMASQARVNEERQNAQTTNAYNIIRFADVLLWAAETEVEVGSLSQAEAYVNRIRTRAANPASWVMKYVDDSNPMAGFSNTPAANYYVGLYNGEFTANGKDYARKAVWTERRLELALEHHRYHDLQRYEKLVPGYMAAKLNSFLAHRATIPGISTNYVAPYLFVDDKHEYWPIPQEQIDLSIVDGVSVLKQNPGYQ